MNYKLRLKHTSGAEFEAEGPAEFISHEKESFLSSLPVRPEDTTAQPEIQPGADSGPAWEALIRTKDGFTMLKDKHPGIKAQDAALLLMAAEAQLRDCREITALTLSRAIKASGYAPERLDRVLTKAIKDGWVKASGIKRNRTYRITDKGMEIAWLEARKLKS